MKLLQLVNDIIYCAAGDGIYMQDLVTGNSNYLQLEAGAKSSVICISISANKNWICCSYANKYMCCWDSNTLELKGQRIGNKRTTGLVISCIPSPSPDGNNLDILLIADKLGEIWATDIPHMKNIVLVSGHATSVVTDMEMSPCGTQLVTCDRDEKIRISDYPQLATISSYCIGHTNVVTSISFNKINQNKSLLLSTGWDHRICVWNHQEGLLLAEIVCDGSQDDSRNQNILQSLVNTEAKVFEDVQTNNKITRNDTEDAEEEDKEKEYDVESAGHFPMKVIAIPDTTLILVIFKGTSSITLFQTNIEDTHRDITEDSSSSEAPRNSISSISEFQLNSLPCDVVVRSLSTTVREDLDEDENKSITRVYQLFFLLPAPDFLQLCELRLSTTSAATPVTKDIASTQYEVSLSSLPDNISLKQFQEFCSLKGMQKHVLDKAFNLDNFNKSRKWPHRSAGLRKKLKT